MAYVVRDGEVGEEGRYAVVIILGHACRLCGTSRTSRGSATWTLSRSTPTSPASAGSFASRPSRAMLTLVAGNAITLSAAEDKVRIALMQRFRTSRRIGLLQHTDAKRDRTGMGGTDNDGLSKHVRSRPFIGSWDLPRTATR